MKHNVELPKNDDDLSIACRFTCTLCPATDIQIHHIDGDHKNDAPENKTVLCQKHHDQAQKDIQIINLSKKCGKKIQTATKLLTPRILTKCRDNKLKTCLEIPPWTNEVQEMKIQLAEQKKEIDCIKRKIYL